MMESFCATLKKERIYHESYATRRKRNKASLSTSSFFTTLVADIPLSGISAQRNMNKRRVTVGS